MAVQTETEFSRLTRIFFKKGQQLLHKHRSWILPATAYVWKWIDDC